ncbi:MAG: tetratricopeptide repeat protein, partial [Phenylobacterium sp.]|nr:tetratricopeptide repeat protein [Phenylobacterium sp.]
MTRLSLAGASALALVLLASAPPALAQTPQDAAACEDGAKLGLEARLQVCDRVIATATAASAAQAHVTRAHLLVDAGRPEEAEADAEAAVKLSPDDPQSLTTRGVVRYELKKYDLALADFDAALKRDPKNGAAHYERGLLWHFGKKDLAKARADYDAAIAADPKSWRAYYQRSFLVRQDVPAAGLKDLDMAVSLAPTALYLRRDRGALLEEMDRPDDAMADYNAVLRADPQNVLTLSYRAYLKSAQGDASGALKDADRAIA